MHEDEVMPSHEHVAAVVAALLGHHDGEVVL